MSSEKGVKEFSPHLLSEADAAGFPIVVLAALQGKRGEMARRIAVKGLSVIALLLRKNHDYGNSAFKSPILQPDMDFRTAIRVRMSDKIARLSNLTHCESHVDEPFNETMDDFAGYAILHGVDPYLPAVSADPTSLCNAKGNSDGSQHDAETIHGLGSKRSGLPHD